MLYSKRRKNLGERKKRFSRILAEQQRITSLLQNVTAKHVGFTGSESDYIPCPRKGSRNLPANLTENETIKWFATQKTNQTKCLKTVPKWADLTQEARDAEIEKQWNVLPNYTKMVFVNATSDAERQYLLYNRKYNSRDMRDWAKYTPDQKMVFISTVHNNTRTPFQWKVAEYLFYTHNDIVLNNSVKWNKMTDEDKTIYMDQHPYLGQKIIFI